MKKEDWPKTVSGNDKADHGRLPLDVIEPKFLADFNHRVKTIGKSVFHLASLPKKHSEVDNAIANRIKLYFGYMLKQQKYLKWEQEKEKIRKNVLAPVEHMFSNHEHCDSSWCYVKKAEDEKKQYLPDPSKSLFNKKK